MVETGMLKFRNGTKGYGFITCDRGGVELSQSPGIAQAVSNYGETERSNDYGTTKLEAADQEGRRISHLQHDHAAKAMAGPGYGQLLRFPKM